jgi:prepilin-type N-terminal cleavage/methylation domain-containing protein
MRSRAFTLTEALIAVAIIAILSTVALNQLDVSRQRGRDAARKGSLDEYRLSIEAYHGKENNYFVHDTLSGKTCTISSSPSTTDGYSMVGTGTGCVGLHGSGQGNMNRSGEDVGYTASVSIAQALVDAGVLSTVRDDPLAPTYGFYLTVCQDDSSAATKPQNATNYALLAHTEIANSFEADQASRRCGGPKTPSGGWDILAGS